MSQYTEITLIPIATTDNAVLLRDANGREEWIPSSQIEDYDPDYLNIHEDTELSIKTWILEQKEFV